MSDTLMTRTGIHLPTSLRFVCSEDRYSVYQDQDGKDVYLAHGTGQEMLDFDDLCDDLGRLWHEWCNRSPFSRTRTDDFLDHLRDLTTEPDEVDDEISFCEDCTTPQHRDDLQGTGHQTLVCESCRDSYYWCDRCEELYSETTSTLHDTEVCSSCRGAAYSYCEECDGWHHDDVSSEHEHEPDEPEICCESPAQSFTVRNDGDDPLYNDTPATITLPAGVISGEGMGAIANCIRDWFYRTETVTNPDRENIWALSYRLEELGDKWQAKEGNFTKRLSRFAYNTFKLKVPPEVVSQVGCIARDHSTGVDHRIEVTRDLNLSAAAFAHEESCWWQSYFEGRCALKTNGGFGLRTFDEHRSVIGRAWVMPLRLTDEDTLTPTFETLEPDAFAVFNGYGNLGGYTAPRIVAHMAGMTYRKISFTCNPMYVNGDSGYLVAPEEIATNYTDGSLSLSVEQHANLYRNERELSYV